MTDATKIRASLLAKASEDRPSGGHHEAWALGYLTDWIAHHCCPTLIRQLLNDLQPATQEQPK